MSFNNCSDLEQDKAASRRQYWKYGKTSQRSIVANMNNYAVWFGFVAQSVRAHAW